MTTDNADPAVASAEEQAHDALMLRLIEAAYVMIAMLGKATQVPPRYIPRILICAAMHGIEQSIGLYRLRAEHEQAAVGRAEHHARIMEAITELDSAMNDAKDALATIRVEFTTNTQSDLIS